MYMSGLSRPTNDNKTADFMRSGPSYHDHDNKSVNLSKDIDKK